MNMSPSMRKILAERDPEFAKFIDPMGKEFSVSDVHVSSASNDGKKKKKPSASLDFNAAMKPETEAVTKAFHEILADINGVPTATLKMADRALKPHPDGGAHAPFPHDPNALGSIPDKHVRRYMAAVTNPDALEQRQVPINSLVAIQPRVSPSKVESIRENGADKLPVVVRHNGKNLLADGTHRAAASWLDGESTIDCKYLRLAGDDEALSKEVEWELPFAIKKQDDEQQMIFGWASVVQKGDYLIVDKQGDMILPDELEKAAYDYVLEARDHGDSHQVLGTGKLVESMVFTKEKQDAIGVTIKDGEGNQIVGWWTGFKINDEVWAKHKSGEYLEFSIGGKSASYAMDDE